MGRKATTIRQMIPARLIKAQALAVRLHLVVLKLVNSDLSCSSRHCKTFLACFRGCLLGRCPDIHVRSMFSEPRGRAAYI